MSRENPPTKTSITAYEQALNLFTDRIQERRLFASYLNDDPPQNKVLFFHGDGGNGKSWLLRMLMKRYCRRLGPDQWRHAQREQGKEFTWYFENAQEPQPVPFAYLDFADKGKNEDLPRDALQGMRLLREQLGKQGLRFPLYDYALMLYWVKGQGKSREAVKALFPSDEADVADKLLNLAFENKHVQQAFNALSVFKLFDRHGGPSFQLYLKKRKLNEENWQRIERLDPKSQLYDELPELFALDLNAALEPDPGKARAEGRPSRVVLLFDTHEAFWGVGRTQQSNASYFKEDEWLRRLLLALELDKGIVVVAAGREPPRWTEAPDTPYPTRLPKERLDIQLVGHLEPEDADESLKGAEIGDARLRQALVRQAEIAPGQVHPLYLGLCADIALAAKRKGETLDPASFDSHPDIPDKSRALMDRLLSYCHNDLAYTVQALAAARAFNKELFFALGDKLHYHNTKASYDSLMKFSFVWPSQKGEGWGRIHDLLRRVLWEIDEEQTVLADAALEDWFRARHAAGDESAIVEAIYHANRQNWWRGYKEWSEVFESAMNNGRYARCAGLIEILPDLSLKTEHTQGLGAYYAGKLALALSQYDLAKAHFEKALDCYGRELERNPNDVPTLHNRGNALLEIAHLQAKLANHEEAQEAYRNAVLEFDQALNRAPDLIEAHINRLNALSGLARLLAELSKYEEAREAYLNAIAAFDKAITHQAKDEHINISRGNALLGLADLLAKLAEHEAAEQSYRQAIAAYSQACSPDLIQAHINQGLAANRLADLLTRLARYKEAGEAYEEAIAIYEAALNRVPENVEALNCLGDALRGLAGLLAELAHHDEARKTFLKSIATFDEVLKLAPDDVYAYNNKGMALFAQAKWLAGLAKHEEAMQAYQIGIAALDEALTRAPDYIAVHNHRGAVLSGLAALLGSLGDKAGALEAFQEAISTFDGVLKRAPNHASVHMNRGTALVLLADLHANFCEYEKAKGACQLACSAYEEASRHAPHNVGAYINKGNAMQLLATMHGLAEHYEALAAYRQAISAYDEALKHAPDGVYALNSRGNARRGLAELLSILPDHNQAEKVYRLSITDFHQALNLAPAFILSYTNRGRAWGGLAGLLARQSKQEDAHEAFRLAIDSFDQALSLAPKEVLAHFNRGLVLNLWAFHLMQAGDLPTAFHKNLEAIASCRRSVDLAPNIPEYLGKLAQTQLLAARLETLTQGTAAPALLREALQTIEQALSIAPDHPQLLQLRQQVQDALRQAPDPSA